VPASINQCCLASDAPLQPLLYKAQVCRHIAAAQDVMTHIAMPSGERKKKKTSVDSTAQTRSSLPIRGTTRRLTCTQKKKKKERIKAEEGTGEQEAKQGWRSCMGAPQNNKAEKDRKKKEVEVYKKENSVHVFVATLANVPAPPL
jgi:hypothetical protein